MSSLRQRLSQPCLPVRQVLACSISAALILTSSRTVEAMPSAAPDALERFAPAPSLGHLTDLYHGSSDQTVVLIQDLHLHYPTQQRIVKILDHLYSKGLVTGPLAMEGVDGPYDTSKIASYPAGKIKSELVDYFMKKGELSAPEAFSVLCGDGHLLYGVDKAQYYDLNRNLFKASREDRKTLQTQLTRIQSGLALLKRQHYPYALRRLDKEEAYSIASAEQLLSRKLSLCPDDMTRNLVTADHMLRLTQRLVRQEVTLEEARYVAQRLPAFVELTSKLLAADRKTPSPLMGEGRDGGEKLVNAPPTSILPHKGGGDFKFDAASLEETLKAAVDFYLVALMRNGPMAEHTLALIDNVGAGPRARPQSESNPMKSTPNFGQAQGPAPTGSPHAIALVAGGFHTAGLTKAFKKAGISYVVITPVIPDAPDAAYHELYEKRLSGEHLSKEEMARDFRQPLPDLASRSNGESAVSEDDEAMAIANQRLTRGEDGNFALGALMISEREGAEFFHLPRFYKGPQPSHSLQIPRTSPVAVGDESAQEAAARLNVKRLLNSADPRFHFGPSSVEKQYELVPDPTILGKIVVKRARNQKPASWASKLELLFTFMASGDNESPARQLFNAHILPVIQKRMADHYRQTGKYPSIVVSNNSNLLKAKVPMVEVFYNGRQILVVNSAWIDEMMQAGSAIGNSTTDNHNSGVYERIRILRREIERYRRYLGNDYYTERWNAAQQDTRNQRNAFQAAMKSWGPHANIRVSAFTGVQDKVQEKEELIEQRLNAAQVKLQRLEAVLDSQKDAESVNFLIGERLAHALSHAFSVPGLDWRKDEFKVLKAESDRYRRIMFNRDGTLSSYGQAISEFFIKHSLKSVRSGWLFSPGNGAFVRFRQSAKSEAENKRGRISRFNRSLMGLVSRLRIPVGVRTSPAVVAPGQRRSGWLRRSVGKLLLAVQLAAAPQVPAWQSPRPDIQWAESVSDAVSGKKDNLRQIMSDVHRWGHIKMDKAYLDDFDTGLAWFIDRLTKSTAGVRGTIQVEPDNARDIMEGGQLSAGVIFMIAQAYADYINSTFPSVQDGKKVERAAFVGFDPRFFSKEFAEIFTRVFVANGIKVYRDREEGRTVICPTATPVSSYMAYYHHAASAIEITSSHNRFNQNGVKSQKWTGGVDIDNIGDQVAARATALYEAAKAGKEPLIHYGDSEDPKLVGYVDAKKIYFNNYWRRLFPPERMKRLEDKFRQLSRKGDNAKVTFDALCGVGAPTLKYYLELMLAPDSGYDLDRELWLGNSEKGLPARFTYRNDVMDPYILKLDQPDPSSPATIAAAGSLEELVRDPDIMELLMADMDSDRTGTAFPITKDQKRVAERLGLLVTEMKGGVYIVRFSANQFLTLMAYGRALEAVRTYLGLADENAAAAALRGELSLTRTQRFKLYVLRQSMVLITTVPSSMITTALMRFLRGSAINCCVGFKYLGDQAFLIDKTSRTWWAPTTLPKLILNPVKLLAVILFGATGIIISLLEESGGGQITPVGAGLLWDKNKGMTTHEDKDTLTVGFESFYHVLRLRAEGRNIIDYYKEMADNLGGALYFYHRDDGAIPSVKEAAKTENWPWSLPLKAAIAKKAEALEACDRQTGETIVHLLEKAFPGQPPKVLKTEPTVVKDAIFLLKQANDDNGFWATVWLLLKALMAWALGRHLEVGGAYANVRPKGVLHTLSNGWTIQTFHIGTPGKEGPAIRFFNEKGVEVLRTCFRQSGTEPIVRLYKEILQPIGEPKPLDLFEVFQRLSLHLEFHNYARVLGTAGPRVYARDAEERIVRDAKDNPVQVVGEPNYFVRTATQLVGQYPPILPNGVQPREVDGVALAESVAQQVGLPILGYMKDEGGSIGVELGFPVTAAADARIKRNGINTRWFVISKEGQVIYSGRFTPEAEDVTPDPELKALVEADIASQSPNAASRNIALPVSPAPAAAAAERLAWQRGRIHLAAQLVKGFHAQTDAAELVTILSENSGVERDVVDTLLAIAYSGQTNRVDNLLDQMEAVERVIDLFFRGANVKDPILFKRLKTVWTEVTSHSLGGQPLGGGSGSDESPAGPALSSSGDPLASQEVKDALVALGFAEGVLHLVNWRDIDEFQRMEGSDSALLLSQRAAFEKRPGVPKILMHTAPPMERAPWDAMRGILEKLGVMIVDVNNYSTEELPRLIKKEQGPSGRTVVVLTSNEKDIKTARARSLPVIWWESSESPRPADAILDLVVGPDNLGPLESFLRGKIPPAPAAGPESRRRPGQRGSWSNKPVSPAAPGLFARFVRLLSGLLGRQRRGFPDYGPKDFLTTVEAERLGDPSYIPAFMVHSDADAAIVNMILASLRRAYADDKKVPGPWRKSQLNIFLPVCKGGEVHASKVQSSSGLDLVFDRREMEALANLPTSLQSIIQSDAQKEHPRLPGKLGDYLPAVRFLIDLSVHHLVHDVWDGGRQFYADFLAYWRYSSSEMQSYTSFWSDAREPLSNILYRNISGLSVLGDYVRVLWLLERRDSLEGPLESELGRRTVAQNTIKGHLPLRIGFRPGPRPPAPAASLPIVRGSDTGPTGTQVVPAPEGPGSARRGRQAGSSNIGVNYGLWLSVVALAASFLYFVYQQNGTTTADLQQNIQHWIAIAPHYLPDIAAGLIASVLLWWLVRAVANGLKRLLSKPAPAAQSRSPQMIKGEKAIIKSIKDAFKNEKYAAVRVYVRNRDITVLAPGRTQLGFLILNSERFLYEDGLEAIQAELDQMYLPMMSMYTDTLPDVSSGGILGVAEQRGRQVRIEDNPIIAGKVSQLANNTLNWKAVRKISSKNEIVDGEMLILVDVTTGDVKIIDSNKLPQDLKNYVIFGWDAAPSQARRERRTIITDIADKLLKAARALQNFFAMHHRSNVITLGNPAPSHPAPQALEEYRRQSLTELGIPRELHGVVNWQNIQEARDKMLSTARTDNDRERIYRALHDLFELKVFVFDRQAGLPPGSLTPQMIAPKVWIVVDSRVDRSTHHPSGPVFEKKATNRGYAVTFAGSVIPGEDGRARRDILAAVYSGDVVITSDREIAKQSEIKGAIVVFVADKREEAPRGAIWSPSIDASNQSVLLSKIATALQQRRRTANLALTGAFAPAELAVTKLEREPLATASQPGNQTFATDLSFLRHAQKDALNYHRGYDHPVPDDLLSEPNAIHYLSVLGLPWWKPDITLQDIEAFYAHMQRGLSEYSDRQLVDEVEKAHTMLVTGDLKAIFVKRAKKLGIPVLDNLVAQPAPEMPMISERVNIVSHVKAILKQGESVEVAVGDSKILVRPNESFFNVRSGIRQLGQTLARYEAAHVLNLSPNEITVSSVQNPDVKVRQLTVLLSQPRTPAPPAPTEPSAPSRTGSILKLSSMIVGALLVMAQFASAKGMTDTAVVQETFHPLVVLATALLIAAWAIRQIQMAQNDRQLARQVAARIETVARDLDVSLAPTVEKPTIGQSLQNMFSKMIDGLPGAEGRRAQERLAKASGELEATSA